MTKAAAMFLQYGFKLPERFEPSVFEQFVWLNAKASLLLLSLFWLWGPLLVVYHAKVHGREDLVLPWKRKPAPDDAEVVPAAGNSGGVEGGDTTSPAKGKQRKRLKYNPLGRKRQKWQEPE